MLGVYWFILPFLVRGSRHPPYVPLNTPDLLVKTPGLDLADRMLALQSHTFWSPLSFSCGCSWSM